MKIKSLIIFAIFLVVGEVWAGSKKKDPKLDIDFRYYAIPTINGVVAGYNTDFSFMDCDTERLANVIFSCEGRGDIVTVNDFSFAFAMGGGTYGDFCVDREDNHSFMAFSLGAGVYYNKWNDYSLTGPCFFLYPMYQFIVNYDSCRKDCKPLWKWSAAWDLGYTFTVFDSLTVYPFFRNILSFNKKQIQYNYDLGIALGFYFHDRNY